MEAVMDAKQFKDFKEQLNQKLYTSFRDLIQGGSITTSIQDDLENLQLIIFQEKNDANNNLILIESVFHYTVSSPDNLNGKLNNRVVLRAPNESIVGTLSDYSQIDLFTMNLLKNHFYQFAKENELLNIIEEGVGSGGNDDSTL
jgi:hypothetical protein